jgi:hypothetical protein
MSFASTEVCPFEKNKYAIIDKKIVFKLFIGFRQLQYNPKITLKKTSTNQSEL